MNISCPLCTTTAYTILYKQVPQYPDSDIVQCKNCGHIYTLLKKEIETDNLYNANDEVYKVVEIRDSIFDKILNREYSRVVKKIDSFKPQKGYLLDFGAGKGKFGSIAKNDKWEVKGVETSLDRAAYAKTVYKLDINTEFYSSGNIFNIYFDVLTLFHVLEHLPDPVQLLAQLINDNVKKDGLIIIEVPNFASWQSGIAKEKWIDLDVPRHLNHFTPKQLEKLFQQMGLRIIKESYFSFHLGVLGMVDSFLKLFGYKKSIIYELKNKKSKILLAKVAILLPFAIVLEWVASAMGKGGIVRMYLTRNQ